VGGGIFVGIVFGVFFWGGGGGGGGGRCEVGQLPARGVGLLGAEAARGEEVGHGRRRRGAERAVRVPLGEPARLAGV